MGNNEALQLLINTLKVDSTSPWINKDTLMKVMQCIDSNFADINYVDDSVSDKTKRIATDTGITDLTSEEVEELHAGDVVVDDSAYIVIYKDSSDCALFSANATQLTFVYYTKTEDEWQYDTTDEVLLGGTKLYKHEITGLSSMGGSVQADLSLTFYSTQDTKVTNMGMLSILNNAISIKTKVMAQGSTLTSLFKDFVVGPNTLSIFMLESSGAFGTGPHNFSGTPEDTVNPL